jgi:hypothetical protein
MSTVRDGETALSLTAAPRSLKSMSSPCWLSTIFGWAESIFSLPAGPKPSLRTRTARG